MDSFADLWDLFSDMASNAGEGGEGEGEGVSDFPDVPSDCRDYSPSPPSLPKNCADSADVRGLADTDTALEESRGLLGQSEQAEQAEAGNVDPPTLDAPAPATASLARRVRPESISAWGGARCKITWRAPGDECLHGAWQAKCPFHRRTAKTACTKSLSLADNTDEQRQLTLRMVKNWLLQGRSFDRGWKHQQWNPRSHECPPENVLDLKAEEMQGRSEPAQPDDELDELAARALAPNRRPKPKLK